MAGKTSAHVTEVPAPHSTRIITCANHKGGTGKTTTAVNVSAGLALLTQQRVLLIDFDPRGHASLALGIDRQHVRYSVTDLLTGTRPEVQALCWHPAADLRLLDAGAARGQHRPPHSCRHGVLRGRRDAPTVGRPRTAATGGAADARAPAHPADESRCADDALCPHQSSPAGAG